MFGFGEPWDTLAGPVISAAIFGIWLLSFRSVRTALFFVRVEYDLEIERGPNESRFAGEWDICWENFKLTLKAGDISNTNVSAVVFENASGRRDTFDVLYPTDRFRPLFEGQIAAKINSIVRRKTGTKGGGSVYTLRLVLHRRRYFWGRVGGY